MSLDKDISLLLNTQGEWGEESEEPEEAEVEEGTGAVEEDDDEGAEDELE
ncbi:MAG: hypothetical protein HY577_02630 [Candidatus Nealsonbacteria bacterium]|nr:hypothetical protein [Candidatus Nealsonbacteria bacterium]